MTVQAIRPEITPVNKPWWDSLSAGVLTFQTCACGNRWLPPRALCPACLGSEWCWTPASGRATLVSWTVFHVAYHEAFAHRVPYNVAAVELAEGPRMITNVVDSPDGSGLRIGMSLTLTIQQQDGFAIALFQMAPVDDELRPVNGQHDSQSIAGDRGAFS
ncbi:MAG: OB-fold domain-containing protein [Rubrivivax sp.]|nr:OB-fold domain-containing protein [Rubrivivax sp.]